MWNPKPGIGKVRYKIPQNNRMMYICYKLVRQQKKKTTNKTKHEEKNKKKCCTLKTHGFLVSNKYVNNKRKWLKLTS